MKSDKELIDWLEKEANGLALVHDDNAHWAVAFDGMQPVVTGDEPQDLQTFYSIEKRMFRKTAREAIEAAIQEQEQTQ